MKFKLFLFDMDGVLLRHKSSWKYCQEAIGCDCDSFYEEFKNVPQSGRQLIDLVLGRMADLGFDREKMDELARNAPQMKGIAEVMAMVRSRGASAVIVSGGIGAFAHELARQYPFDDLVVNELTFVEGRAAPECEVHCGHEDKGRIARAIQASLGVSKEETVAVGDYCNDCFMFAEAGLSIAFNGDAETRKCASYSVDSDDLADILPIIDMYEKKGKE